VISDSVPFPAAGAFDGQAHLLCKIGRREIKNSFLL
jgi:hypothetical protein